VVRQSKKEQFKQAVLGSNDCMEIGQTLPHNRRKHHLHPCTHCMLKKEDILMEAKYRFGENTRGVYFNVEEAF